MPDPIVLDLSVQQPAVPVVQVPAAPVVNTVADPAHAPAPEPQKFTQEQITSLETKSPSEIKAFIAGLSQEDKDKMREEFFAKAANGGRSASSDGGQDIAVPNPFVGLTPRRHKSDTANARPSAPANPRSTPTPSRPIGPGSRR